MSDQFCRKDSVPCPASLQQQRGVTSEFENITLFRNFSLNLPVPNRSQYFTGLWEGDRAQPHPENRPDAQQEGTLRHAIRVQQEGNGAGVNPVLQGRKMVQVWLHYVDVFGRLIGTFGCVQQLQTQMPGRRCHVIYSPTSNVHEFFVGNSQFLFL